MEASFTAKGFYAMIEKGWGLLCDFLDPVPSEPFPHRNAREEYRRFGAFEEQHRSGTQSA